MPVLKPDADNEASLKIANALTVQQNLAIAKKLLDSSNTENKSKYYRFKMTPSLPAPSEKINGNR